MPLYKVGTLISPGSTHIEYVEADYFTFGIDLTFYHRGEGEKAERKDTCCAMWKQGTYSFVREVQESELPYLNQPEGKEECCGNE